VLRLTVIGILLWAGAGLVVGVLALLTPVVAGALLLAQPGPDINMTTLLVIVGAIHWLVAGATVLTSGGLLYAGNWLLYQGRRSVGPTVLLVTWTLFAVPSLILSPAPFLLLPPIEAMAALLCLEAALALAVLVLGLGLRFYLHSDGVWSTLC